MDITLHATIPTDGRLDLLWQADAAVSSYTLLIIRTGAVPAYTSLRLSSETVSYQITNLSRHQRYRIAVLALGRRGTVISPWVTVTPRVGCAPRVEDVTDTVAPYLTDLRRVTVMPQDQRLTVYWQRTAGFVDAVRLELVGDGDVLHRVDLEPEVNSLSLDGSRGVPLHNGRVVSVRLHVLFAGKVCRSSEEIRCVTAPMGQERAANRELPQEGLIYPTLSLAPEVEIFTDVERDGNPEGPAGATATASVVCMHCRKPVTWRRYRMVCSGCGAEYIPNGRGDFLDMGRLRFGTCCCCLPKKILVQQPGGPLRCAHSGKEHIRIPGSTRFYLIEDLPFGLCQCCRPRRPLMRKGRGVSCSKSGERHRNESGRYVLVPSAPVFDAALIDDLLDAGMAEICSTGVSRRSA